MNARDIAIELCYRLMRPSYVMPSLTPRKWYECDVVEVTKASYMREYEIKTTRADYFKDAAKASFRDARDGLTKHKRIEAGDVTGPCQFSFVVPEGLIDLDTVPSWAGFVTYTINDNGRRVSFRFVKPAPRLHKSKCDERLLMQMFEACYWRYLPHLRAVSQKRLKEQSKG